MRVTLMLVPGPAGDAGSDEAWRSWCKGTYTRLT